MITEEQRNKKIQELSDEIEQVYFSPETGIIMLQTYQRYIPTMDKYETYALLIGDTILGLHKTAQISQQLQSEFGISADVAQRIFGELRVIFAPVIERERMSGEPNRAGIQELQQNFKALREEAIQHHETPQAAPATTPETPTAEIQTPPAAPGNLPMAEPTTETAKTIQPTPIAVTPATIKTSYTVEPMRTMEADITRVHGYGAYRDLYPDEVGEQTYKEETIRSASQEELLKERPTLAEKPTYTEET